MLTSTLLSLALASAPPTVRSRAIELATSNSSSPQLTTSRGGNVYLTWLEKQSDGHALRFATFRGGYWKQARTIHEGKTFFANWADVPSVVELEGGELLAQWLEKQEGGIYAYHVRMARSADGGATWGTPFTLHDDTSLTEHGFVSLVPLAGGDAAAVWLDGRGMTPTSDGEGKGDMQLRFARISPTGDVKARALLDPRVCECCATTAVATATGVTAFYRDRSPDEVRDIYSVTVANADVAATPQNVTKDGWNFEGCPVNGAASHTMAERVALAWYTEAGDKPRVQLALSKDGGAHFSPPTLVADGRTLGRVGVVWIDETSALVSWLHEEENEDATIRVRRVLEDGSADQPRTAATTTAGRRSGIPRLAATPVGIVIAWTDAGTKQVRTAILDRRSLTSPPEPAPCTPPAAPK